MSNGKRIYSNQFKQEAIALWEASEKPASAIEQELGITAGLLSRWRRNKRQKREVTKGQEANSPSSQRIRELEREVAILRQEREILKKAKRCLHRRHPSCPKIGEIHVY